MSLRVNRSISKEEIQVLKVLRRSIDLNAEDWGGYTALNVAAVTGNLGIVKTLIEAGARVSENDRIYLI